MLDLRASEPALAGIGPIERCSFGFCNPCARSLDMAEALRSAVPKAIQARQESARHGRKGLPRPRM